MARNSHSWTQETRKECFVRKAPRKALYFPSFTVEGEEYQIKRTLIRNKRASNQDKAFLSAAGRKMLSPSEGKEDPGYPELQGTTKSQGTECYIQIRGLHSPRGDEIHTNRSLTPDWKHQEGLESKTINRSRKC